MNCAVCESELVGRWSDLNGEILCVACGTPHQVLRDPKGCNIKDEFLPAFREYWTTTGKRNGQGCFLLPSGYEREIEERAEFYAWIHEHHPELLETERT